MMHALLSGLILPKVGGWAVRNSDVAVAHVDLRGRAQVTLGGLLFSADSLRMVTELLASRLDKYAHASAPQ